MGLMRPFCLKHSFSVVRSSGQATPNYVNPIRRDVVSTGFGNDNVTIRFRVSSHTSHVLVVRDSRLTFLQTDNPGPWLLHCHIDWHLSGGLAIVFAEDVPDTSFVDVAPSK